MARPYRVSFAGALFHITTRGNNRDKIFLDDQDFQRFKASLRKYRTKYDFKLYAYTLMPNHVHLLIETSPHGSVSQIMHAINTSYAKYFNSRYDHTGHVWEGRFHSKIIDSESYFLEVMRYMDLNPVRARIVKRPENYEWASHARYGQGGADDLVAPHELYRNLGETDGERERVYSEYVEERLGDGPGQRDPVLAYSIFVGGDDFESRMVRLYGREIWPKYRRLLDQLHELRNAARPE